MRMDDLKSRTIYVKFDIGDIVYLKCASRRCKGMVTGINVRPAGYAYTITWADGSEGGYYDIELTTEFIPDYEGNGDDDD